MVLDGQQKWWPQGLLADLEPAVLFIGATLLTAVTDNAALTYLGSLVEGATDPLKYSLVARTVTGGGLTVIEVDLVVTELVDGTIGVTVSS